MHSSKLIQRSTRSKARVFMFFNATPHTAEEKHASFVVTLGHKMPSPQAIFEHMPRCAGVKKSSRVPKRQVVLRLPVPFWARWVLRTVQSLPHLNVKERGPLPIPIASIQRPKLGTFPIFRLVSMLICPFRAEIVRWVSESMRPFEIVNDRGFQCLMKTGRPDYYIPSPSTVSRDVKQVFIRVRKRIAKMLQVSYR